MVKIITPKFKSAVKVLLPKKFGRALGDYLFNKHLENLKKNILNHYEKFETSEINEDKKAALAFLKNNKFSIFPGEYSLKYKQEDVDVSIDKDNGLLYVIHNGKRLYFKRSWNEERIKAAYNFLLIEQDTQSPHRYLTPDFFVDNNDIVIDAGAAEGNFSLSVVEKASKIFIIEADEGWIEAIKATFEPWKEKVIILNKFVSDKTIGEFIKLDTLLQQTTTINFIKADVEGAERQLLEGCENIFKTQQKLRAAICCYHNQQDEEIFSKYMSNKGFKVEHSNGYMIYLEDKNFGAPYLRRGLIRATKIE